MSGNLGLTLRDDPSAPDRLALVDLLDVERPREYGYPELKPLSRSIRGRTRSATNANRATPAA